MLYFFTTVYLSAAILLFNIQYFEILKYMYSFSYIAAWYYIINEQKKYLSNLLLMNT